MTMTVSSKRGIKFRFREYSSADLSLKSECVSDIISGVNVTNVRDSTSVVLSLL